MTNKTKLVLNPGENRYDVVVVAVVSVCFKDYTEQVRWLTFYPGRSGY